MGFIRGFFVVLFSVLLFLSFLLMNSSFTISSSLEYEHVHDGVIDFVNEIQQEAEINLSEASEDSRSLFQKYCKSLSEVNLSEVDDPNLEPIEAIIGNDSVIPCDVVEAGSEPFLNYTLDLFVNNSYYAEYDCGFVDCFGEYDSPLFLFSQKAKLYFEDKAWILFIVSLVLAGLILLFTENKTNGILIVGVLLFVSALPFMKLGDFFTSRDGVAFAFLSIFFSESYSIFIRFFLISVVLVALAILLKFLLRNSVEKKFSVNDVKQMIKKEMSSTKGKKKSKKSVGFFARLFGKGKGSSKK